VSAVIESVADLLERLGNVPAHRVRMVPTPGTASVADLEAMMREGRLCELIDGTLVEKAMGVEESLLAVFLIRVVDQFVSTRKLGLVTEAQGLRWLAPTRLRGPDLAFTSWARLPRRKVPTEPYPHIAPDLVVEVLSRSNTRKEMKLKRQDYFGAGTSLVWEVDPRKRTVSVYTSPEEPDAVLTAKETLTGASVLRSFTLRLADLFARLDQHG
jgi:Uma2 family endonuclease